MFECPQCKRKIGIELDRLDIHLKGKTNKEIIDILHFNWKLQEEFCEAHKGTIEDLKHNIKYLRQRLNHTRLDLIRCEDRLRKKKVVLNSGKEGKEK